MDISQSAFHKPVIEDSQLSKNIQDNTQNLAGNESLTSQDTNCPQTYSAEQETRESMDVDVTSSSNIGSHDSLMDVSSSEGSDPVIPSKSEQSESTEEKIILVSIKILICAANA